MSWLEKIGLVEREVQVEPVVTEVTPEPEIEVDAEINSATNVVDEIYAQNDLSDMSNSIYTVQELMNTLPAEMTTAKKQSTVNGILMVTGKSVADLLDDAQNRIDTLCAARDKIVNDRTNEIAVANGDIEELKKAIEVATIKIKEAEDVIEAAKKSVNDEIDTLDELIKFCEGMSCK
jgi:LPS O-antigen subunit length determinant protein (WzzB/FepE family)